MGLPLSGPHLLAYQYLLGFIPQVDDPSGCNFERWAIFDRDQCSDAGGNNPHQQRTHHQVILVCDLCLDHYQFGLWCGLKIHLKKKLELKKLSAVSLGGIVGSLARWGVSLAIVDPGFPWATLMVNYIGSILLAVIVLYVKHHDDPRWWWRPALGTGFCGGFTTYSAFAVKIDQDLNTHNYHGFATYVIASLVGTFILVYATSEFLERRWAKE